MKTTVSILTTFTLIAFAANSLLCRIALKGDLIDPASFTAIRLLGGVLLLVPLAAGASRTAPRRGKAGSWASALALFLYAIAFSAAYLFLDTGMGALILFGSVQATMIGWGIRMGERPHPLEWAGLLTALAGLIYLVAPGITSPHPLGAFLMVVSGISWGVYSLRGRRYRDPLQATAGNFLRAVPPALLILLAFAPKLQAETSGILLALLSGSVTSGLGYVLWYRALQSLSATRAALVQLLVPVLAALGGVMVLEEVLTLRLGLASIVVLGGVAMASLKGRSKGRPGSSR